MTSCHEIVGYDSAIMCRRLLLLTGLGKGRQMDPLQAGITAARQGRRAEARAWLQEALRTDANNEQAWLWLSTVVETDAEHRMCLERALAINPHNETTRARLEDIARGNRLNSSRVPIERLSAVSYGKVGGTAYSATPLLPADGKADVLIRPLSPESLAVSESRPPRRLPPHLVAGEMAATLPNTQIQAPVSAATAPASQSTSTTVMAFLGCLSVTAVSGLLVLVALLLLGWAS
jgi:hypothetical protein